MTAVPRSPAFSITLRSLMIAPLLAALGACEAVQQTTDQAGRDAAKTAMPEVLAVYFPQVPKDLYGPFSDCVVSNADASDVQSLASDAVTGVDQGTADTVRAILERPATQECLRVAAPEAAALPAPETGAAAPVVPVLAETL
ncbi:MAG: hypothetical protein AAF636_11080 [Pseudomonadota bacterium]